MDYHTFVSSFRESEPNLVDAILSGYSIIFESTKVPSVVWHGTDQYTTDIIESTDEYMNQVDALTDELVAKTPREYSSRISKYDLHNILLRNVGMKIWTVSDDCVALANKIKHLIANVSEHNDPVRTHRLNFTKFTFPETNELGIHFGTKQQAERFGEPFPFRVTINNPLRLPDLGTWAPELIIDELRKQKFRIPQHVEKNAAGMRDLIRHLGYDGVVYKNDAEGHGDSYIAFSNDQIHQLLT